MAKTEAEAKEMLTVLAGKVEEQMADTKELATLVLALLAKVPPAPDYQELFDAAKTLAESLSGDDEETKAAIDAAKQA